MHLGKYENDLQRAVDCLYSVSMNCYKDFQSIAKVLCRLQIDQVIQEHLPDYKIIFPNLKQNKKIDLPTCNELEKTLERFVHSFSMM